MAKFKNHDIIKENRSCDLKKGLNNFNEWQNNSLVTLYLTF